MTSRVRHRTAATLLAAALSGAAPLSGAPARAHSTGETGHSGKQGSICNACHSGGAAPAVRFLGPAAVAVGGTATYRFEVQSMGSSQRAAGFNVAASSGVLGAIEGQGERLVASDGELTHAMPKANADMVSGWEFTWTAPDAPGAVTLFGAGNSVNLNGQNTGDRARSTTFEIVVADAATPTPTATPLPPQPTATVTPSPTRTPAGSPAATRTRGSEACVGDCDGSDAVAVNELVTGVIVALGNVAVDACPPVDADGDARVSINELVAAVANALNGCP